MHRGVSHWTSDVEDLADGTYAMSYYAVVAGTYSMDVLVGSNGPDRDLRFTNVPESFANSHIVGSPFLVIVRPGAVFARSCTAFGQGLLRADAGLPGVFTIEARDEHGNPRAQGGDLFTAELRRDQASPGGVHPSVRGMVEDLGDGRYRVQYTSNVAGQHTLYVGRQPPALSDQETPYDEEVGWRNGSNATAAEPIAGSPFSVYILPQQPTPEKCLAEGSGIKYAHQNATTSFTLRCQDTHGNWLDRGGDSWFLRLRGPSTQALDAIDNEDGTYTVFFTPEIQRHPGGVSVHDIDVRLAFADDPAYHGGGGGLTAEFFHNPDLHGSPHHVQVQPSVRWGGSRDVSQARTSVRWSGFVKAPVTDDFTLILLGDDHAELFLDGVLLVTVNTPTGAQRPHAGEAVVSLESGVLYEIRVEAKNAHAWASVALFWKSAKTPRQLVPPYYLYPGATPIVNSPFSVNVF